MGDYDPDKHHRRSIRLKGYDYISAGAYFITICTYKREALFGDIVAGEMRLSEYGRVVSAEWLRTPKIRQEMRMDEFVVMPNHIHGIVWIDHCAACQDRSGPLSLDSNLYAPNGPI